MIMHWISQYRFYIWGITGVVWLVATVYLGTSIKQEHDIRMQDQQVYQLLTKQIVLLQNTALLPQASPSEPSLLHNDFQKNVGDLRDYATEAGVTIHDIRIYSFPALSDKAMRVRIEAEASYVAFLAWIARIKKENLPIFLQALNVSVNRALSIEVQFVVDPTIAPVTPPTDFLLKGNTVTYDPFCLHESSRIARAYRHDKHWQHWLDVSQLSFKTKYTHKHRFFALFSWQGKLFWLEQGNGLPEHDLRLQHVFSDHAEVILPTGKRIAIFRQRSVA